MGRSGFGRLLPLLAGRFILRPEIQHAPFLRDGHNLFDNRLMRRRRRVRFQALRIVEREHVAMREAFVVLFGAVVLAPLKRLDRVALRRQLRERFLDLFHLLRRSRPP